MKILKEAVKIITIFFTIIILNLLGSFVFIPLGLVFTRIESVVFFSIGFGAALIFVYIVTPFLIIRFFQKKWGRKWYYWAVMVIAILFFISWALIPGLFLQFDNF